LLEGLGNIGDFIGGIGVVITLVYLAMQIRHNTRGLDQNNDLLSVSFENQLRQSLTDLRLTIAGDPALTDIWERSLKGLHPLDGAEQARFELLLVNVFNIMGAQFNANARGIHPITSPPWLLKTASTPGFQASFARGREEAMAVDPTQVELNGAFWDYVESLQRLGAQD
jgi:hypothetical protein